MSKVLPVEIKERPELNLRQGIKSSLNSWRPLLSTLYLFYLYSQESGNNEYGKEVSNDGKTKLEVEERFAAWLESHYSSIHGIRTFVEDCPLFSAQIEHLQVGLELFLKLGKVQFADQELSDSRERTGGNRYLKRVRFSTNMKILADVISAYSEEVRIDFLKKWLNGADDDVVSGRVKELLSSFTEECQYKIRTSGGERFFQQEGVYECLRNDGDTVESSDVHEPVGPFRILKSYVKEGMHPYLEDGKDGFKQKGDATAFASYADMVSTALSLIPKRTMVYQEKAQPENPDDDLLTTALKLFKAHRNEFAMGEKVNEGIRAYFDLLTEEGLRNFTEEQFTDLFLGKEKYEHMWSGTNGKGWGHIKNAGREAAMNFIADLKAIPVPAEEFCDKGFDAPSGFGRVTIAELQMKFRPTEFCAYSKRTAAAFRILKLDEREFNGNFTAEDYNAILAITETVRSKMEEMGIGLTRKDASKPDYLSANEFVDFVLQNETLILQEWGKQMKHEIDVGKQEPIAGSEGFKAFIEKFHEAADKAGLTYDLDLVRRFVCAMLAKKRPFVILTGLSGSGKTKLAEAFSKWMGVEHTHMLVSVGADWTNSEKLLGFPNALEPKQYVSPDTGVLQFLRDAEQNHDVPFFLILDEMNLSHVECYFADFLSAMESSDGVIRLYDGGEREDENGVALKPTITFPKNLFIIGTMNVDETTRASSPKVLDRAQVIEFRVSKGDLAKFLDEPKELDLDSLDGQGKTYSKAFLDLHDKAPALDNDGTTTNRDEISSALKTIFEPLAELGAEFGYRTAGEAMRFCAYDLHAGAGIVPAIDAAVMQKLLPKLHGSQARLGRVLREIAELSEEEYEVSEEGGEKKKAKRPKYPLTHEKVGRMMVRVKANGFTGFAEA